MTLAASGFAVMTILVRMLSAELHPFEIAFFRNLFGLLPMVPWMMRSRLAGLRTNSVRKYALRAGLGIIGMFSWFNAVAHMPLADATSLSFIAPIFTSILAMFFLGERAGIRRWCAILVGFGGALLILRPGFQEIHPAAILQLGGCVAVAGSIIMVKMLSRTESSSAIVTYMGLYLVPMSLLPSLFVWETPRLELWPLLIAMGGFATLGQWAMTQAYAAADATVVLPFDYARLPFVALIGYFIFSESIDLWTWAGGLTIAGAAVYIAQRESRMSRRHKAASETPSVPEGPGAGPSTPTKGV
jgi:drug/metabolite transporter (DMT)-like permease